MFPMDWPTCTCAICASATTRQSAKDAMATPLRNRVPSSKPAELELFSPAFCLVFVFALSSPSSWLDK